MLSNKLDWFYGLFATTIATAVAVAGLVAVFGAALAAHDESVANGAIAAQQCVERG